MELTHEQIAEFERRAEAGEKPPGMEWIYCKVNREWSLKCSPTYRVCEPGFNGHDRTKRQLWWGLFNTQDGNGQHAFFHALAAAQLAAEHLLREAMRPLFEAELTARDARIAELEGQVAELSTPNHYCDSECDYGAWSFAKDAACCLYRDGNWNQPAVIQLCAFRTFPDAYVAVRSDANEDLEAVEFSTREEAEAKVAEWKEAPAD